ncbi:hypothetical protein BDZ91DRAFT_763458 [Kalaharituber pfeilii]|nr:hypothetical protein BDZ91DRAFT_763458 [Kalaharituber pfeilii]
MAQQPGQRPTGRENLLNAVDAFSKLLLPAERSALTQTTTPDGILELTTALKDARVSEKKIKRCEAFLQSVQQFSGIVDTMIQHNACISALVWGSVKILLLTARNYIRYFSCLTDLLEKLGMVCPIFKEFQDLWPHFQGLQDAIFEYYAQTVKFCADALDFYASQQKIVEYQIILARERTAREARQHLILFSNNWEAHREEERQEWTCNSKWRQRLEANATGFGKVSPFSLLRFRKSRKTVTAMGENRDGLLDLKLKQETQKRLIHVLGNGYSKWMSTINGYNPANLQFSGAMEYIIRSLIKQMLSVFHGSTQFEEYLVKFFSQYNNISSIRQWQDLFIRTCRLPNYIYLIIDGIDECHNDVQAQILEMLNKMLEIPRCIKIYLSSRKEVYLTRNLTYAVSVSLDDTKCRPEIEGYIDASLQQRLNDKRLRIQDPAMIEEIRQALMGGVEGMQLNDEEIRETLRTLPRNLDETYIRMLQRIVKEHKKDIAVEAFLWLTTARRRLSLRELVEAVVIKDHDSMQMQGLNRIPTDLDKVIEACGNFLVIEEPVCDSSNVRFIHSTVVTFLHEHELPVELKDLRTQLEPVITEPPTTATVSKPKQSILSIPLSQWIPPELRSNSVAAMASQYLLEKPSEKHVPEKANLRMFSRASGTSNADSVAPTPQVFKSSLFQYVIENWLSHCERLPTTGMTSIGKEQYWRWFRVLVLNGSDLVKLPWPSDSVATAYDSHHERFKWAVQNSHEWLVHLIYQEVASEGISPPHWHKIRLQIASF